MRCRTGIETSDMLYKTNGNYEIDFINRDRRTIDRIVFEVHLGSGTIPIRDVGSFTPGIRIVHRYPNRGGQVILAANPTLFCEVRSVPFTDGTEWHDPGQRR